MYIYANTYKYCYRNEPCRKLCGNGYIYKIESDRYMTYEINKSEDHYIPLL